MAVRAGREASAAAACTFLLLSVAWIGGACSADPVPATADEPFVADRPAMSGEALVQSLGCGTCHAGLPVGAAPATPLDDLAGSDPARVLAHLRPSGMAHPDFHLDDREVAALARYLNAAPARSDRSAAAQSVRDHDEFTAADGARLFAALNCGACHPGGERPAVQNGPVLALEGERARIEWLRAFLLSPQAIRPFGARPGDGGRMPRFALTAEEVDSIVTFLTPGTASLPAFSPVPLSDHSRARIRTLLTERYSCLGCHAFEGEGGRVGPDLSGAGRRRSPQYIRAMLDRPGELVPGTIMPPTPAPAPELDELASFLAEPTAASSPPESTGYLSPLDYSLLSGASDGPAALYATRCGACHGTGGGDGFNAAFLRARPADHGDAAAMAERTDARLFDAIAGGARFLDGSPEMPAFADLTPDQVRTLVQYVRALCSCAQPDWAADGGEGVER